MDEKLQASTLNKMAEHTSILFNDGGQLPRSQRMKPGADIPITVVGGRGPHGLALHLLMQAKGLAGYALVDPAPHWLPLYGPGGPLQATGFLRSPRELDFSFGCRERAMTAFVDEDGSRPLQNVYSLKDAARHASNESITEEQRAPRAAFWRYANCVAKRANAEQHVIASSVTRLEPLSGGWQVKLANGASFSTRVVLLANGLTSQLYLPQNWRVWWRRLPAERAHHAFKLDYAKDFRGEKVAVLGSSNIATWETAIQLARRGARVTLLSRHYGSVERQLPFAPCWLEPEFVAEFTKLPWDKRKRLLKKPHIPGSALPGMAAQAKELGVRIIHHARIKYGSDLWSGVQLHYKVPQGMQAERFDHVVAATGASPKARSLSFLADAAKEAKAPIIVGGVARHRPILDEAGRWKNLPPLYPLGSHALTRAGHAANTLASASVYLPLSMPAMLQDAGLAHPEEVRAA